VGEVLKALLCPSPYTPTHVGAQLDRILRDLVHYLLKQDQLSRSLRRQDLSYCPATGDSQFNDLVELQSRFIVGMQRAYLLTDPVPDTWKDKSFITPASWTPKRLAQNVLFSQQIRACAWN